MSITATNNPYPESPDASPTKLDKGGYDGNAETLDNKIDEMLAEVILLINNTLVGSASVGSIVPSSVPPATGAVHAFATQAGTYTNWGGFVIPSNTFAFISRSSDLVFSISQTTLDVSGKLNVSDVINTLTSTEIAKPLSAAQGKALNEKFVDYAKKTESVTPVIGKNKLDVSKSTLGKFMFFNGDIADDAGQAISDYIPVTGNMIKNIAQEAGTGNSVYDINKNFLRAINTNNYTFQAGDAFVRWTYRQVQITQIENGNIVTAYEPYTDKGDVVLRLNLLENILPISFDLESIFYAGGSSVNGTVRREYGFDIPIGSTGNGTIHYVRFPNVKGKFKIEFYFNTNIPANKFGSFWHFSVVQESVGVVKMTAIYDNITEYFDCYLYPENSDTAVFRTCRFSKVVLTPYDLPSYQNLQKIDIYEKRNILEVAKFFTSGTTGWGVSKFNSIIEAHNSLQPTYYESDLKRTIRLMPGTYDEFETVWAGVDGETNQTYQGIVCKNEVNYESFDKKDPALTVLKWDGHAGFSNGYVMNTAWECMTRCIFHISEWEVKCEINGFTVWSKNTRYCIHPESAGSGYGNHWKIKNCILQWEGRPQVADPLTGVHLGIGISPGEIGEVENVKFTGSVQGGLVGHNNGLSTYMGVPPFIVQGAKLLIKDTDFNGHDFRMDTLSNDERTLDIVEFENVVNINTAGLIFYAPATKLNWRAVKKGVTIVTDNLVY